jgi:hypothetical protein
MVVLYLWVCLGLEARAFDVDGLVGAACKLSSLNV